VANYPVDVKSTFATHRDLIDPIMADHVNSLQTEVVLIENTLGTGITTSASSLPAFNKSIITNSAGEYDTLRARLENIEAGVIGDAHTQYVNVLGGSTIQVATNSTVNLTLKAKSGQTADILSIQDSSGNVSIKVDKDQNMYVGSEKVAVGATLNPLFLIGC
jgi:hypothetical protein